MIERLERENKSRKLIKVRIRLISRNVYCTIDKMPAA